MKVLNRFVMPALALVLFFGTIGVSQATGSWVTSGRQGWMTLDQAALGLGMPVADLIGLVGAPPGAVTGATAFKDIEAIVPGFSLATFRTAVQARLDLTPKG